MNKAQRLGDTAPDITIELDGVSVPARAGEPLAAALIAAGTTPFSRSVKYHRPRGAFCLEAACSNCLMRVDGVPNVYTCRTPARQGQRLERQNSFPSAKLDVFSITDWFFPRGLNHHELFAGVPIAQEVMAAVARQLAGLGTLPDSAPPSRPEAQVLSFDVAVVGAGPSGLAASAELTALGIAHVVFERESFAGGRAVTGPSAPEGALPAASPRFGHTVVGLFDDEGGRFLAVVTGWKEGEPRLLKVYAKQMLIAMGGHSQLPAFVNNDLPGIYAGRAVSRLIRHHRVLPGQQVAVVGHPGECEALATLLKAAGAQPLVVGGRATAAHGLERLTGVTVELAGSEQTVECDAMAVCEPVAPSYELARQGGARVRFDGEHFVVEADADGRTGSPVVFVAGEQLGPSSIADSIESGRRAARALAGASR